MLAHGKSSAVGIESGWMEGGKCYNSIEKFFKNILNFQLYFKDRLNIYSIFNQSLR